MARIVLAVATIGISSASGLDAGNLDGPAAPAAVKLGKLENGGKLRLVRVRHPFPGFLAERLMLGVEKE